MAIIALENITIGYRGPTLLEKASCRIEENQHIGLLGRNGAGKTTLMRLILGIEQPDDGQIIVHPDKTVAWLVVFGLETSCFAGAGHRFRARFTLPRRTHQPFRH